MPKTCHHYVPKLYLRGFLSGNAGEDVINVYEINKKVFGKDRGLKGQCSRPKFYGDTDDLEDLLASFENRVAPVLQFVRKRFRLPEKKSDREQLVRFIALQMLRTEGAAARVSEGFAQLKKHIESHMQISSLRVIPANDVRRQVEALLSKWPHISSTMLDLGMKVVVNKTNLNFFTSDNPVLRYNQYCQGVKGISVDGTLRTGIQIFLPISPKALLILFDRSVYKFNSKDSPIINTMQDSDVNQINLLQAIHAEEKILFADWSDASYVERLVREAGGRRNLARPKLIEAVSADDPKQRSLLHLYTDSSKIKLHLSFVSFRRQAKRATMEERVNSLRGTNAEGAEMNRRKREAHGKAGLRGTGRLYRFIKENKNDLRS